MINKLLSVFILCLGISSLGSLTGKNTKRLQETIIQNFIDQELSFPQEKLYLHTDRNNYWAGENIYFKAYLLNANFHTPQLYSHYVYVELINATNRVIKRVKIRNRENIYEGYLPVKETLPEGFYTIRAYTTFMRNMDESFFFRSFVYIKSPEATREKIVPEFNYGANGEVNVSLSFIDLRSDSAYLPLVLNLEINDKKVTSLKWDDEKTVSFTFKPDKKDSRRIVYVEAENYRKYLFIPASRDDFEVSFFPEGGYLVDGISCCVAFKAVRTDGRSEEVKGEITDDSGNRIMSIQTSYDGRGLVYFTPRAGQKYYAVCENSNGVRKQFALPEVSQNEVALSANWVNDLLYVSLQSNDERLKNKLFYLLIHTRGTVQYFDQWDASKEVIAFNKTAFDEGISHILLLDSEKKVISERLIYCNSDAGSSRISLALEKDSFSTREKVMASLRMENLEKDSLNTNLSLLVRDKYAVIPEITPSLRSYLLLNSDLREDIVVPDFYFKNDHPVSKRALDMLMLTCNWQRHPIQKIINGDISEGKEPFEIGQEISGRVKTLVRGKPVKNSEVSIISIEHSFADKAFTNEKGIFSFNGFEFPDSTAYVVQALSQKGSEHVELMVEEDQFPEMNLSIPAMVWEYENYLDREVNPIYAAESDMRHIFLEGIEVKARFREKKEETTSPYVTLADQSFTLRDIEELDATCLHELFRRIPGLRVDGEKLYIRGTNSIYGDSKAALFIDGVYVDSDLDLDVVNMPDVQQVDVFKTGNTVIWGTRGGNGVVSITTKRGDFLPPVKEQYNIKRFTPLGYQRKQDFYLPSYDQLSSPKENAPDLRTTVFWEPGIRIKEEQVKELDFYTADISTEYEVIIEGITDEGEVISYTTSIEVH